MAQKGIGQQQEEFPFPLATMMLMGVLGAMLVGASFEVIKSWPLPVSIAPYFGWRWGAVWGLIAGCIHGLVLGFITDDSHFNKVGKV